MPTPPTRRTVLGVMAAAASAPSVLALSSPASARTGAAALPGGGDLGPNVVVFDPSTPNIQGRLDEIFRQQ
ncbi:coagulation factor 5/8 type domain-containing protein, partial [Streptomyces sp. NPDC057539]